MDYFHQLFPNFFIHNYGYAEKNWVDLKKISSFLSHSEKSKHALMQYKSSLLRDSWNKSSKNDEMMKNIILTVFLCSVTGLCAQKFGFKISMHSSGLYLKNLAPNYAEAALKEIPKVGLGVDFVGSSKLRRHWELHYQLGFYNNLYSVEVDRGFLYNNFQPPNGISPNSGFHNIRRANCRLGADAVYYRFHFGENLHLGLGAGFRYARQLWANDRYNYTTFFTTFPIMLDFLEFRNGPGEDYTKASDLAPLGFRLLVALRVERGKNRIFEVQPYLQHYQNRFRFEYANGIANSKPEIGLSLCLFYGKKEK